MSGFINQPDRIRRTVAVLAALAGLSLAVFTIIERPLVGVGVYTVAMIGSVAIQSGAERPVFDERDEAIHQEAAGWTLAIFGWTSAGVFPALTVAWGVGVFEWQPWSSAIAFFVTALYLTYGVLMVAIGRRR